MVKTFIGGEAVVKIYEDKVEKVRRAKKYRVKELDRLIRAKRTASEAKIISMARKVGVPTPIILDVFDTTIVMERIDGELVKDIIDEEICRKIGKEVAKLHSAGIIHGDLTPKNMIYKDGKIFFIDFGLSFHDERLEAKGVDIHVFYEALKAEFDQWESLWNAFIEGYSSYDKYKQVVERFREIQMRGRYTSKE